MWTRADLKRTGKIAFTSNFLLCVLVGVILLFLNSASSGNNSSNSYNQNQNNSNYSQEGDFSILDDIIDVQVGNHESSIMDMGTDYAKKAAGTVNIGPARWIFTAFTAGVGIIMVAIAFVGVMLISILILNPLRVGCYRFFYSNLYEKAKLGEISHAFGNGWLNTGLVLFKRDIKLLLWTLLLIIPGIIKTYEYRMIPYLLAENPQMTSKEAFEKSRELMDGQKMNAFILDLSFIGWHLLGALTLGLGEIFWTVPYQESTNAALYDALRGDYL